MALSFNAVEKAYQVMGQLKKEFGSPKTIPSWPLDIQSWSDKQKEGLVNDEVFGYDKKRDDGWENLFFILENPSPEFLERFKELAKQVPNSSFVDTWQDDPNRKVIGWF